MIRNDREAAASTWLEYMEEDLAKREVEAGIEGFFVPAGKRQPQGVPARPVWWPPGEIIEDES